ncbi:GNAT family N-acetyltransferase [Streptomyces poriticola]|uniref:GNAT family N-acetyltransferase n=1 Tax=Streptomyces poriticola TaxID=3120506 RepID=UPI002FCE0E70
MILGPDDWRDWRELRPAALADAPHAFGSRLADRQGEGDREERRRARPAIPGSCNLVARVDGHPAGMASGVPDEQPGTAELISPWVGPAARGHGVGSRLVAEVERWAVHVGAGPPRLSVRPGNGPALALYERHGFRPTGEPGDLLSDGVGRETVLAKPLVRT